MELNHTIIWCHDKVQSADFSPECLVYREPEPMVVRMNCDNGQSVFASMNSIEYFLHD